MPIRIAIVLRYKDDLLDSGATTVEEHNNILRKRGKVWLGKFGLPIKPSTLKLSAEPGVVASLILVRARRTQKDTDPRLFIAPFSEAQNNHPRADLIPTYYRKHCHVDTWFCLTSEIRTMKTTDAQGWVVASSREPLLLAIRNCPRTFFLVARRPDVERLQSLLTRMPVGEGPHHAPNQMQRRGQNFAPLTDEYGLASDPFDPDAEPAE